MLDAILDPAFNGADLLALALLVAGLWKLRPHDA
jgi:hypothetical protein